MSLCHEITEVSKEIYNFSNNVTSVQEETLTEYLMWKWSLISKKVTFLKKSRLHTKIEESKSGADFELEIWIIGKKKSLPFFIQAKKLFKETNSYCNSSLNYNTKKIKPQYQLLIDKALSKKFIPLYMFYTNLSEKESIYIADAFKIKNKAIDCSTKKKSKVITRIEILNLATNFIDLFFRCKCSKEYQNILTNNIDINDYLISTNSLPKYLNEQKLAKRHTILIDRR